MKRIIKNNHSAAKASGLSSLRRWMVMGVLAPLLATSCGLMDMEEQQELVATQMQLGRDSLYIMVGDTLALQPEFTPDSVTVSDIYWASSAPDVLSVADNVFTARSAGWALVTAVSVARRLEDSCHVCVMPRWESMARQYPHEMMVYADVSVGGRPFTPDEMVLGAFVDDELRGIGEGMEWKGRQYVRFRIGSETAAVDPDNPDDESDEVVTFRVYHRSRLAYEEFPQKLNYDGETHGTLSSLFKLSIEP